MSLPGKVRVRRVANRMDNDHNKKRGMLIPVEKSFAEWRKDPAYLAAHAALDDEFAEAESKIAGGAMTGRPPVE